MRFAPFYVLLVCLQPPPLKIDFPFQLLIFLEGGRGRSCKIDIRHVINRNVICSIELMFGGSSITANWMSRLWISNVSIPVWLVELAHLSIASFPFHRKVFELFIFGVRQEIYLATVLECLSSCTVNIWCIKLK